ncbi:MAG TPA: hypothetical protein VKW04_25420 [Planctomycetota bacterium]|nr:hypothetical protein [Planctomycetota bacterium]
MIGRTGALVSFLLNALALPADPADAYSVEFLRDPAPPAVAEPVRALLSPSGLRVLDGGKPALDFWFRTALLTVETKSEKGVRYGMLKPGALVGVVRVHDGTTDFRAQRLGPGLYTMRYAIQPDDGDHQDMTEARDFLLLSAIADDLSPDTLELKALVRQSAKLNGKKHPGVLSLAAGQDGPLPRIRRRGAPEQVVLDAEVPISGGMPLRLTIVVVGKYKE